MRSLVSRSEAIGGRCCDVFHTSICESGCALRHTLETGEPVVVNRAAVIIDTRGRKIPISISTPVLRDDRGRPVGGVETFRDLSQVEQLRKELAGRYSLGDIIGRTPATLRSLEECHIADALRRHHGNRKAAAEELGIHPSTLFRKIRDLGIEVPEFDGRHRAD